METTVRDIILLITGVAAAYLLIGYVARSIMTMRYQMTPSMRRNPYGGIMNRVYGRSVSRK